MFSKTAVTDPISSPRTSTAGSGPPPSPPCRPPTPAAPSTTGHTRAAWGCLSQTTGRRLSSTETRSPAWPSSTTTTETVRSPCVVMTNDSDIFWCLVFNKRLAHYCVRRGEQPAPPPPPPTSHSPVAGIKWHDVACTHEKPIICEDVDGHLAYARQHFPQIRIP